MRKEEITNVTAVTAIGICNYIIKLCENIAKKQKISIPLGFARVKKKCEETTMYQHKCVEHLGE